MSWTFVACTLVAFAWILLFFLWGKSFLLFIHANTDTASSIAFGYLIIQTVYQIIYLPFYFTRGSFRSVTYTWMGIVAIGSVLLIHYLLKHPSEKKQKMKTIEKAGICVSSLLVLALSFYITHLVPYYGADTVTYISKMNEFYYKDSLWVNSGNLSFHYGMCSMLEFFTAPTLLTGIKPYYLSIFTVRIVGICLFSLVLYRTGNIIFNKGDRVFCFPAAVLSVLAPYLLMFWGSNYTAEFFYWRINEAKGFCQFVLLPISFSIFIEMLKNSIGRKPLWKQQILVGFSSVAVSASSLTSYLFLLLMGTLAVLAYDKLKQGWRTIGYVILCSLPNMAYLSIYILEKYGYIVL